ncbi:MAG: DUF5693 family protein [candidate division FCPU426 bacterium]
MKPLERWAAALLLVAGLGWVAGLTLQRLDRETRPRRVEIAFSEQRLLAETAKDPEAPQALRAAGVTTLVREPYTLQDMLRFGLAEAWHPAPERIEIRLADTLLTSNAVVYLTGQFGLDALQVRIRDQQFICDVTLPAPLPKIMPDRFILEIPAGPMPEGFRRALALPAGDWGVTDDLNQFTGALSSLQPEVVIPIWKGGLNAAAFFRSYFRTPWLRRPAAAIPEFSLVRSALPVLQRQSGRTLIRAHVLEGREASRHTLSQLRRRLVRAVRERQVGFLYLNPPAAWPFSRSLELLQDVTRDLDRFGIARGPSAGQAAGRLGHVAAGVLYLGVGAIIFLFAWQAALWAAAVTGRDPGTIERVLTIRLRPLYFRWLALFGVLALFILHGEGSAAWGAKIAAWLLAVLVPLLTLDALKLETPRPAASWQRAVGLALQEFALLVFWNALAGLAIAALLYQRDFILGVDGFWGVKAAYGLPLALAGVYLFPDVTDPAWWRRQWKPKRLPALVLGAALLAALGWLLWLRTGNTTWAPASSLELAFRDHLETWLGVRPRLKEFLFGHPLLLLGLFGRHWRPAGERLWPRWCLWLGLLGQISLINSFMHVHTPLAITALRTLHGLWLGALVFGLLLAGVLGWHAWLLKTKGREARGERGSP